jgi:hypothetical protein
MSLHAFTVVLIGGVCLSLQTSAHHAITTSQPSIDSGAPLAQLNRSPLLCEFESRRNQFLNRALIQWRLEVTRFKSSGVASTTWHYTSRFAGRDQSIEFRGDDHGVVSTDQFGMPRDFSQRYLISRDGTHWTMESQSTVRRFEAEHVRKQESTFDPRMKDVRILDVISTSMQSFEDALWANDMMGGGRTPIRYEEVREPPCRVVTLSATVRGRAMVLRYWFDESRGRLPTRGELTRAGQLVARMECEHDQFSGAWFPRTVVHARLAGDRVIEKRIYRIERIERDGDLPSRLDPSHIGVEPGVNVVQSSGDVMIWDGQRAIASDEFDRRVAAGTAQFGPNVARHFFGPRDPTPRNLKPVDKLLLGYHQTHNLMWRKYVSQFSQRHGLTAEQNHGAAGILADCENRAAGYLASIRGQLSELAIRLDSGSTGGRDPRGSRGALHRQRNELGKPLSDIFEQQLKPRLAALLTAEQTERDARDEKPGSQSTTVP